MLLRSLALAIALLAPARALACATCECGDPTLTVMGAEKPFQGRLRFGLQARGWSMDAGLPAVDLQRTSELRFDLSVAYAPLPWLFVSATMPLHARQVVDVSLARESVLGPGDLDLRAKAYVYRDKEFASHHLLAVIAGVVLPTGPVVRDPAGTLLSLEAQPGTGAITPVLGLSYSGFFGQLSVMASATGGLPSRGYQGFQHGPQARGTLAGQYQLHPNWGLRLSLDGRWEGVAHELDGTPDPLGSGYMAFVSPDVVFSPGMDVVLQLGVRLPVLLITPEPLRPGPMLTFGVAYDR